MTMPAAVNRLLTAQRLKRVPADTESARLRLARADEKLEAARKIAAIDVDIAYVTMYDAARIAVTASHGRRTQCSGVPPQAPAA